MSEEYSKVGVWKAEKNDIKTDNNDSTSMS